MDVVKRWSDLEISAVVLVTRILPPRIKNYVEKKRLHQQGDEVYVEETGVKVKVIMETFDSYDWICGTCEKRCDELCDAFWQWREEILLDGPPGLVYDEYLNEILLVQDGEVISVYEVH